MPEFLRWTLAIMQLILSQRCKTRLEEGNALRQMEWKICLNLIKFDKNLVCPRESVLKWGWGV